MANKDNPERRLPLDHPRHLAAEAKRKAEEEAAKEAK